MPPPSPVSPGLWLRQRRTSAQRCVRKALFDQSQARLAAQAAAAAGLEAAAQLVNAHLTARYAPDWPLPAAVAAVEGLAEAVAAKLFARGCAAASALRASLERLAAAQRALEEALAAVTAELQPSAGADEGEGERAAQLVVYTGLQLLEFDALAAEVVAMHAAELERKRRIAEALLALFEPPPLAREGGAPPPPSRDQLTVWLRAWKLAPSLDSRRLEAIEAQWRAEIESAG